MSKITNKHVEKINSSKHLTDINKRSKLRSLKGLFLLFNEHYWKTFVGPFFTFAFPTIVTGILGWMLGYFLVLAGSMGISVMTLGLVSMPQAIFEFKQSSLLKRIGATPIKPIIFILCASVFYVLVMIASILVALLASLIMFGCYWDTAPVWATLSGGYDFPSLKQLLEGVNWGCFIYSQLWMVVVSVSIGMFLVSISKSAVTIQSIGVFIMIISMFLSGQLFPITIVKNVPFFWWVGYLTPFKCTSGLIIESWYGKQDICFNINGSDIFDFKNSYEVLITLPVGGAEMFKPIEIFRTFEKILNLLSPLVWTTLFVSVASIKFKWSTR